MNLYLIYGLENYLIDEKLNEIYKKTKVENDNIIRFNLDEDSIYQVLLEASTVGMFSDKKLIIVDNSNFLTSSKSISDDEINELNKYIDNPFEDVTLVFIVREEKLDQRKKITKNVVKNSKVFDCNKIDNYKLNDYISNYIRDNGYSISSQSVDLIISKVGYELSNIMKELEKLFIYKDKDKKITKEDVEEVITKNIEKNIFELTNAIVDRNKEKINRIYKELILAGEDPIKLIVTLSNQFRLILQVKLMRQGGYSEKEIVTTLKEHPYRINLAMNSAYSIKELKNQLLNLSDLDYKIVTGEVDKFFGFEMFLLEI